MEINKKPILIMLAIVLFAAIAVILAFVFGKGTLSVTAPYDDKDDNIKFRFDGTDYETPKKISGITPGSYTITSEIPDAKPFKKTVNVGRWTSTAVMLDFEPLSKENESFRNKEDVPVVDTSKEKSKIEKSEPLTKHLPYFGDNFIFDYYTYEASDDDSETKKTVVIYFLKSNNFAGNLPIIQKWITQKGINLEKINIADGGPL